MTTIECCYYSDLMGYTEVALGATLYYTPDKIKAFYAARQYDPKNGGYRSITPEAFRKECYDKFNDVFVSKMEAGKYYLFIVTNAQRESFLYDAVRTGLDKYCVFKGMPAVNSNYPSEGPKLHTFLFQRKG